MNHEFTILHLYAGIGGGALGTAAASARMGIHSARFRLVGGVDIDPLSCEDFRRLTGAPALEADMHTLQPADLRAFCPDMPDAVLLSPPCKGFSRLLSARRAAEDKYQKLNRLLLDGLFLLCSTWDRPPPLIFVENVPGIMSRGHEIVRQARALLDAHDMAMHDGTHNCGEIGGLAQSRPRWFMVARCRRRVPQLIYKPPKLPMRACGDVLGPMPMPGSPEAGPLHALPRISWRTWVRLALIPAGGDWRDLPGVVPPGKFSVADPRIASAVAMGATAENAETFKGSPGLLGVNDWEKPAPTVTGSMSPTGSNTPSAVADPRFTNIMQVSPWDAPARTVIGASRVGSGALSVADPRGACWRNGTLRVLRWDEAAATITGSLTLDNGAAAVADPRPAGEPTPLDAPLDPDKPPPFTPIIIAPDGTWHRPLTTLELAALQGLPVVVDGRPLMLAGAGHTRWREAIGNAIPPPAAAAIGDQLLLALLVSRLGTFAMSPNEVWVEPEAT